MLKFLARKEDLVQARAASLPQLSTSAPKERAATRETPPADDLREISDEALAERMQRGENVSFETFYDRYHALVRRITFRILHDHAEAEDAAQTVFWDIYRSIQRFDPQKGTLRGWVMQYAHHRALNHKKSLQLRGFYTNAELEAAEPLSAASRRPLLAPEATHAVRQALQHLSEDQQQTLRMIFLEGQEMEDVARKLGQNVSNIRHHYYRGMKKLRDLLNDSASRRPL